jgi:predicted nucleic acid-binding protein
VGVVVSDTSPLLALGHLNQLDLLGIIHKDVVVPPAVAAEALQFRPGLPTVDVSQLAFARIVTPTDYRQVQLFLQTLDAGEAEALALALEIQPDAVLIDEDVGRTVARQNGLITIGTLRVLLDAKTKGLIPLVKPLMERLITEIKFRVSPRVQADVLRRAGE